jgi:hypothetical protein
MGEYQVRDNPRLNRKHFDRLDAGLGLNTKQVLGTFKRATKVVGEAPRNSNRTTPTTAGAPRNSNRTTPTTAGTKSAFSHMRSQRYLNICKNIQKC